ncbi:broad specificity phosphatase PhoE [Marmoricola sp. URHA0025 HA25]
MGQLLLVRHGQASWDGDDYDVLSEAGHRQGELLGIALSARGTRPDVIVSGGMRRHRETVDNLLHGAGLGSVDVQVDRGWDEYDHVSMLAQVPTSFAGEKPTAAEFQAWMEQATDRWIRGENAEDYHEPFAEFTGRVEAALRRAVGGGHGTTVVITSGGPIGWVTAALLGGGAGLWSRLNVVCVNTGVTKLVSGRRGTTLVSFNEHTHLEGLTGLLTYR